MINEKRYIRANEVKKIFGISKSTLYRYSKQKENFPKPLRPSPKIVLWNLEELEEYFKNNQVDTYIPIKKKA